jgi:hypothetical protein
MRNSSIFKSRFFIAGTGRRILKEYGRGVAMTALYLTAGPSSHMSGIYYLSPGTAAAELCIDPDEFMSDVAILEREGFCRYDREASVIWVVTMLAHQVSAAWKDGDRRMKTIRLHLDALPDSRLILAFRRHYGIRADGASDAPSDAPSDGACHAGPNPLPVPKPVPTPSTDIEGSYRGATPKFPQLDENGLDIREADA